MRGDGGVATTWKVAIRTIKICHEDSNSKKGEGNMAFCVLFRVSLALYMIQMTRNWICYFTALAIGVLRKPQSASTLWTMSILTRCLY